MSELRWTLLIIGVVFLAVLAWWELRRASERAAQDLGGRSGGEPAVDMPRRAADGIRHEPTISFPEPPARETLQPPPVVQVSDDSPSDLRVDGTKDVDGREPAEVIEPIVPAPPADAEVPPVLGVAVTPTPADPIVEWPDESVRRIIALRLVAPAERFSGRAVRQALMAEGFVLGKLSIFHRAGPDGRAVVSAASLTKPGTFDRESIDMQRYGGLNLFAVLPGPLPPGQTFDVLLSSARNLGERLQGALQDERGEPLTPMRVAMIRESLAAEAEASG